MLKLHGALGKTGDGAAHNILDRLEHEKGELQIWSKKQMDHLIAVANRTWLEHSWSAVKTVAECVVSVVSFAMGGYFLAQGGVSVGGALIASGVLNILQTVFARQGMWDWISRTLEEKNETYRNHLKPAFPIVILFFNLALSAAGHRYATVLPPTTLIQYLEGAKGLISTGGEFTRIYLSIKKGYDDARLPEIQGGLKRHELSIDLLARFLESILKEGRRIKSAVKQPINALMQATNLASQKV
jgi:hypothetical protein